MSRERLVKTFELATQAAAFGFLLHTTTLAFSRRVRREILHRDQKTCQDCGVDNFSSKLQAAHYNHDKSNPDYDSVDTGRMLCTCCHFEEHVSFVGRAEETGLTEEHNEFAVRSLYGLMDPWQKRKHTHPDELFDPQQNFFNVVDQSQAAVV